MKYLGICWNIFDPAEYAQYASDLRNYCGTFHIWMQGDELKVKVNKLTSTKTQLPYSYYSLPFCRPEKILDSAENLGEVLRGDRIENSPTWWVKIYCNIGNFFASVGQLSSWPYWMWNLLQFKMREPQMCSIVGRIKLDAKEAKEFKEKINDEYRVNMYDIYLGGRKSCYCLLLFIDISLTSWICRAVYVTGSWITYPWFFQFKGRTRNRLLFTKWVIMLGLKANILRQVLYFVIRKLMFMFAKNSCSFIFRFLTEQRREVLYTQSSSIYSQVS